MCNVFRSFPSTLLFHLLSPVLLPAPSQLHGIFFFGYYCYVYTCEYIYKYILLNNVVLLAYVSLFLGLNTDIG